MLIRVFSDCPLRIISIAMLESLFANNPGSVNRKQTSLFLWRSREITLQIAFASHANHALFCCERMIHKIKNDFRRLDRAEHFYDVRCLWRRIAWIWKF